MLVKDSLDEMKKREASLKSIKSIINNNGRDSLHDLTGLSGGFLATQDEINLLETYIGPAIFEEKLQTLGKEHLGGEKIFAVNRTSSGILATILSIGEKNKNIIHFLPEFPAHPSIPRSCKLIGANYSEFDNIDNFIDNFSDNVSLVIITGSTMDHKVLDEKYFEMIIDLAKMKDVLVFVDDASGARLRTSIYSQKKATELGADLVITSTDKLMMGPRGGLMAGKSDLIDIIKTKAHQFGLEAQPPNVLAMIKGLEIYDENDLKDSLDEREKLMNLLKKDFSMFKKTPTGAMVSQESLKKEIALINGENQGENQKITFSSKDLCFLWSMVLLKEEYILTIPAVSMPGASPTVRFDLASNNPKKLDATILCEKIKNSFKRLLNVIKDEKLAKEILYT